MQLRKIIPCFRSFIGIALATSALSSPAAEKPAAGQQVEQALAVKDQDKPAARYLLFLPKQYDAQADKAWPLILFLHGRGESYGASRAVRRGCADLRRRRSERCRAAQDAADLGFSRRQGRSRAVFPLTADGRRHSQGRRHARPLYHAGKLRSQLLVGRLCVSESIRVARSTEDFRPQAGSGRKMTHRLASNAGMDSPRSEVFPGDRILF